MKVRKATGGDMAQILSIYEHARQYMREQGNGSQWGDSYPEEDLLRNDILREHLMVICREEQITCVFAFIIGDDPTYQVIRGNWHCYSQYGTIHRVASAPGARGMLRQVIDYCAAQIPYLRIDTHENNQTMQNALRHYGFCPCGTIHVEDGSSRIAFDRMAFPEIKGRLGMGFMRMPETDGKLDEEKSCALVDSYMAAGFNYFDTARGYMNDQSEKGIRKCLTERYPRDSFVLCDKLTDDYFHEEKDILPLFENQLQTCGVEYFDFYLMHAMCGELYPMYKRCRAFEIAFDLKRQGKVRHVGISFHDKAELLEQILNDYPEIELVQLQVNYFDFDDAAVEGRKCCEVCRRHGKPVFVMEPVRGGLLSRLPDEGTQLIRELDTGISNAGYAIRFAADVDGVQMVLSGMSDDVQLQENATVLREFTPLTDKETKTLHRVRDLLRNQAGILCTGCNYCIRRCPENIQISSIIGDMNSRRVFNDWNSSYYYGVHTRDHGKASACIRCGACEEKCPQHLPIRDLMTEAADMFENKDKS